MAEVGVTPAEIIRRAAILDTQKLLRGVSPGLAVDGLWGPKTSAALQRAPEFIRGDIERKLVASGVDVARVATTPGNSTLSDIAQKAIDAGISGPSLVNFLTTLRMESNFVARRESHVYRNPSRAREKFSTLRGMSDEQIRALVASGAPSFFEAVYGYTTRKGRMLGNVNPGDGFKFRGNGIIQITGRDNHLLLQKDTGIPAVSDPDVLVRDPDAGVQSAIWYWKRFVMSRGADLDIVKATKVVNSGLDSGDVSKRIAMARLYSAMNFTA